MLTKFLDEKDYPSIGTHGCKARCPLDVEVWEDCSDVPEVIYRIPNLQHGRYFVSNFGNIKSIGKSNSVYLKYTIDKGGYKTVNLVSNKKSYNFMVHRIVFSAFGVSNNTGVVINHIDTNRKNNKIENLENVTQKQNQNTYNTRINKSKGKCRVVFLDTREVFMEFISIAEAARYLCITNRTCICEQRLLSCFALEVDYKEKIDYEKDDGVSKYYFINGNKETVFSSTYVYQHFHGSIENIAKIKNGEELVTNVSKGIYAGTVRVYRLTCKEIWEHVEKKKWEQRKKDYISYVPQEENKEVLKAEVNSSAFLHYVQINPQVIEDFHRYKASLAANNQVS